jgi:tetratricopeptide (TPR) repeat protein
MDLVAEQTAAWEHSQRLAVDLGGYFEFRHHVDDWLTTGTLAVEAGRKLGAQAELEAALTLGNAYRVAHRYEESVACEQRALALAEDDRSRSPALHNLGLAYFCQGRYMKAEFAHQRDRRLCTLRGDLRGAAQAGVALGDALRARRRFPEAAKALEGAIAQFEALEKHGLGDPRGLMNARMNLALTYLDGRPLLTASYIIWQLCSALAIARDLDQKPAQVNIFLNLSRAYRSRCPFCHHDSALDWARRSITMARQVDDPAGEAHALIAMAMAQADAGDITSAQESFQLARGICDELGLSEKHEHLPGILRRLAAESSRAHVGCPSQDDQPGSEFTEEWVEDLPHAVLRGDDKRPSEILFVPGGDPRQLRR